MNVDPGDFFFMLPLDEIILSKFKKKKLYSPCECNYKIKWVKRNKRLLLENNPNYIFLKTKNKPHSTNEVILYHTTAYVPSINMPAPPSFPCRGFLCRVTGGLEPIPTRLGWETGYYMRVNLHQIHAFMFIMLCNQNVSVIYIMAWITIS